MGEPYSTRLIQPTRIFAQHAPSVQVRHLLDKLLIADPVRRATLPVIEADPWFVGPDGLGIAGADVPLVRPGAAAAGAAAAAAMAAHASATSPAAVGAGAAAMPPGNNGTVPVTAVNQTTTLQQPSAVSTASAASTTLPHVPSAKDIEEAVEDVEDVPEVRSSSSISKPWRTSKACRSAHFVVWGVAGHL